jgi:formylglycine-generating enzyme required for sulfatase activity
MEIDDRHPVEAVSAREAERTLARLGLTLPTEAQWEYAARAGTTTPWWTGAAKESLQSPKLAANLADQTAAESGAPWPGTKTWPEFRDGFVAHAPVGSLAPNPFGLYDVHGNVWEFVRDGLGWYDKDKPRPGDGLRGIRPEDSDGRIARGGSFAFDYTFARVSLRYTTAHGYRNDDLGFRPSAPISE